VDRCCRDMKKRPLALSPEALEALREYRWPGNVRELQNCIERAVILVDGDTIHPRHLNLSSVQQSLEIEPLDPWTAFDFDGTLTDVTRRAAAEVERRKIEQVLRGADQNRGRAADILGITYKSLATKMKEYRLE
jgi:DNA-binding NtrC family response regulator